MAFRDVRPEFGRSRHLRVITPSGVVDGAPQPGRVPVPAGEGGSDAGSLRVLRVVRGAGARVERVQPRPDTVRRAGRVGRVQGRRLGMAARARPGEAGVALDAAAGTGHVRPRPTHTGGD